jgi:hypothetical protein
MQAHIIRRELIPFLLSFAALVAGTLLIDAVLHQLQLVWIGRYLGIPGTLLIVGSFAYSMRKRKLIKLGHPAQLLVWHERMAWLGSLLVLAHAGIHFNSILGWLAVLAMLVNVCSGLIGKLLLDSSRRHLQEVRAQMQQRGATPAELEDQTYWDSLTFDAVKQWRSVHFPITLAFVVLGLGHIFAVFLFWGWK